MERIFSKKGLILALGVALLSPWYLFLYRIKIIDFPLQHSRNWIAWMVVLVLTLTIALSIFILPKMDHFLKFHVRFDISHMIYEFTSILLFYLGLYFQHDYPYLVTLGLLLIILIRLIFFHRPFDFFYFVLGASLGPTLELILTNFHFYIFTEPNFLGIPYWLPIFWGNVALVMRRISWTVRHEI